MLADDPCFTHTLTTAAFPDEVLVGGEHCELTWLRETLAAERTVSNGLSMSCCKLKVELTDLRASLTRANELVTKHAGESASTNAIVAGLRAELADQRKGFEADLAKRDETIASQQESNENLWRDMNKVRASNGELREENASLRTQLARATAIEEKSRAVVTACRRNPGRADYIREAINSLENVLAAPMPPKPSGPACEGCDHCDPAVTDEFLKAADIEANTLVFAAGCDADDLATTANDMDVARRHGRVCRLHRAATEAYKMLLERTGLDSLTLLDALHEFSDDDLSQIPPETKADRMISELRGMVQRQAKEIVELQEKNRNLANAAFGVIRKRGNADDLVIKQYLGKELESLRVAVKAAWRVPRTEKEQS